LGVSFVHGLQLNKFEGHSCLFVGIDCLSDASV
jgi:hypothetical protein